MKTILLTLCCILGLFSLVWAHNATDRSWPQAADDIFIGQDPETGDEIMSVGSGSDTPQEQTMPDAVIITPEVIWPPKRKHHHKIKPDQPTTDFRRITPGTDDPHIP